MNNRVKVWDLPTRLFHWGLLLAVFYSWFSVTILEDMQQHFYAGYAVLTLLLFRIIWGCVGSTHSRFGSFFYPFKDVARYAVGLVQGKSVRYIGHNPLGALSAIAMILVLSAQAVLGLFSTDDYFFGPLSGVVSDATRQWLTKLHLDNVTIIYALLGLHVSAILFYQWVKNEALIKPMITGYKERDSRFIGARGKVASNALALVILVVCVALVYWLANAYSDIVPVSEYDYY